jgi:hypothetical protein
MPLVDLFFRFGFPFRSCLCGLPSFRSGPFLNCLFALRLFWSPLRSILFSRCLCFTLFFSFSVLLCFEFSVLLRLELFVLLCLELRILLDLKLSITLLFRSILFRKLGRSFSFCLASAASFAFFAAAAC